MMVGDGRGMPVIVAGTSKMFYLHGMQNIHIKQQIVLLLNDYSHFLLACHYSTTNSFSSSHRLCFQARLALLNW